MDNNLLHIIACPHPFKLANQEYSFAPTLSLTQVLREVQPDDLLRRRAHIWVNDTYISPEKWESTYPEAGSHIDIRVVPGGRAFRTIGRIFVAIAAIAVAFIAPWAFGLTGALAGIVGGLAGMAVGIVGNMALNALFPPARPGGPGTLSALAAVPGAVDYGQSSPTLAITGAKNRENLWGPVPFILGRFRVAPFYGASPYTESVGGDQYLRLLFVWGFSPMQLEDLRIADSRLENYQGVEIEHRNLTLLMNLGTIAIDVTAKTLTRTYGSWLMDGIKAGNTVTLTGCTTPANDTDYLISNADHQVLTYTISTATTTEAGNGAQRCSIIFGDDPLTLYPVSISETALSIELEQNVENIQTSGLDADELSIDVACSSLMGLTSSGSTYEMQVAFEVFARLTGTSDPWAMINRIIVIPGTPATPGTPPIPQYYTTDPGFYGWVGLLFPSKPDIPGTPGTSGSPNVYGSIVLTGNTKSSVRGNVSWEVPVRGQYDVKVKRITAPDTIWTSSVSYWVALRTIKNEDPIDFPHPLAKTAMRIKATGQLSGMVEEFKGTVTTICPDLNTNGIATVGITAAGSGYSVDDILTVVQTGASGGKLKVLTIGGSGEVTGVSVVEVGTGYAAAAGLVTTVVPAGGSLCTIEILTVSDTWITRTTQNPASLYRLALQGIQNQMPLADSRIDLAGLQYWHEYCETQGWKYNKYIDYNCTVEDLLKEIAASARSAFSRIDSKVGVIIDEPQTFNIGPAFTPRNILDGSFQSQITIVNRPHAFRCPFVNEDMQYQQDERLVLADGYQIDDLDAWGVSHPEYPAATLFEQIDLPGVTDPELIFRHARYHYAVATLRCETFQFDTDIEWMVATRGDRIKFAHDVMLTGLSWGRVKTLVMETTGSPPEETGFLAGVTVDEYCPIEGIGVGYVIRFRLSNNVSVLYAATAPCLEGMPILDSDDLSILDSYDLPILGSILPTRTKEIVFPTPIPPYDPGPPPTNYWPAAGDLFLFGNAELEAIDLIIKSIQPHSDLSATVIAVPYDENIYQADVGTIPAHDPKISAPAEWWSPVISWIRSGGSVLFPIPGGGWQSRILVSLSRPSALNSQITGVEAQFWVTNTEAWTDVPLITLPVADLDSGEVSILPVTDGQSYDFRLRYVKKDDSRGPWCATETHVVEGKTAPPANVTGFYVVQAQNIVTMVWAAVADLDRSGYEIRFGLQGENWGEMALVNGEYSGTTFTTTNIPPGTWDIAIKAIDTSGNYSTNETRKTFQVYPFYAVLSQVVQGPLWGGTLENYVRNPLTGNLNPDDQDIPDGNDFNVFDNYVVNPFDEMSYTAPEIDLGSDEVARAWSRIYRNLGPGESGSTTVQLALDYKLAAGAYDGFDDWTIGFFEGRYVKFKIHTAIPVRITQFETVIDQP